MQVSKNKTMKTIRLFLLSAACLSLGAFAQNTTFQLKGKVGSLNAPAKAYLMYREGDKMQLDSTDMKNGEFLFKGSVSVPTEAYIRINHDGKAYDPVYKPKYDVIAFMIENQTIQFVATDSIAKAQVSGSELNSENSKVTAQMRPFVQQYGELDAEYKRQPVERQNSKEYIQDLDNRAAAIAKAVTEIKLNYADSHPDSYLSIMLINSTLKEGFDAIRTEKIYNKLSASISNTPLGQSVIKRVLEAKRTQVGIEATDFTQNDVNGKPVKLSSFRGKYVLIDFWASWCAPCRRENPNVREAYAKYKERGFEVLGVSLDKEDGKTAWLKAIETDQLPWTQVSDLKGWANEVAVLYGVKAIPANFLLDPKGHIIAKDLRGQALNQKLAEIFK